MDPSPCLTVGKVFNRIWVWLFCIFGYFQLYYPVLLLVIIFLLILPCILCFSIVLVIYVVIYLCPVLCDYYVPVYLRTLFIPSLPSCCHGLIPRHILPQFPSLRLRFSRIHSFSLRAHYSGDIGISGFSAISHLVFFLPSELDFTRFLLQLLFYHCSSCARYAGNRFLFFSPPLVNHTSSTCFSQAVCLRCWHESQSASYVCPHYLVIVFLHCTSMFSLSFTSHLNLIVSCHFLAYLSQSLSSHLQEFIQFLSVPSASTIVFSVCGPLYHFYPDIS